MVGILLEVVYVPRALTYTSRRRPPYASRGPIVPRLQALAPVMAAGGVAHDGLGSAAKNEFRVE